MSFLNAEHLRYELRVRRAGRWEILDIVDDPLSDLAGGKAQATSTDLHAVEASVIARARQALAQAGTDAARVTRARTRENGFLTETVIFSDERSSKAGINVAGTAIVLGQIEGAAPPPCTELGDFCQRPAYRVTGQLLRSFLERTGITAFELFHHGAHQRELAETKTLIPGAIERVAKLQAGADPRAVAAHKDRLTGLVARLRAETASLASVTLPTLKDGDFQAMADGAGRLGSPETAMFRIGAAFSRSLAREAGLPHRIAVAVACLERPLPAPLAALLDTFLACVFDDPSATGKVLSGHQDRAGTLQAMADLARGSAPPRDPQPVAKALASMLGAKLLPQTSAALWARIRREIDRGEPLSQFEPTLEREKLGRLRTHLLSVAPEPIKHSLEAGFRRRAEELRQAAINSGFT